METAWREAQQGLAFKAQPLTICAYDVNCAEVADLTDPATCADLGVSAAVLDCPWEDLAARKQVPPSWTLAPRLGAAGIRAIIVPSFAPGVLPTDRNVVFWRWSAAAPCSISLVDDDKRLPRNDLSWSV